MTESQEVERILKMRQEFKECQMPQENEGASHGSEPSDDKERILELIKKIKN